MQHTTLGDRTNITDLTLHIYHYTKRGNENQRTLQSPAMMNHQGGEVKY